MRHEEDPDALLYQRFDDLTADFGAFSFVSRCE